MAVVLITLGSLRLRAELCNNPIAQAIENILPISQKVSRWGDEIYFPIPLKLEATPDARADVEVGDLTYWPEGHCLCIFYGKTPASLDDKPRAASPVMVVGKVKGDASLFKHNTEKTILIEKAGTHS